MKKIVVLLIALLAAVLCFSGCDFLLEDGAETYKITFSQSGEDEIVREINVGESILNKDIPTPVSKKGYTVEWDISNSEIKEITEDTTVTALETANDYTVTYNTDGGSRKSKDTFTFDSKYEIKGVPTKAGYTFAYWEYDGEEFSTKGTWKYDENITLKAIWEKDEDPQPTIFTITFVQSGKTDIKRTVNVGESILETNIPTPSQEQGYNVAWELSNEEIKAINKDTTVNALVTYTITFVQDGQDDVVITLNKGESIADKDIPTVAEENGYNVAWNKDTEEIKALDKISTVNAVATYTITFVQEGQEDTVITLNKGESIADKDIPAVVEENGYNVAWDKNTEEIKALDKISTVNAIKTVAEYTITYNLDGGEAENPANYTIEDENITLINPTKTGYTFTGWTYEGQEEPLMNVVIEKGSIGNKEYTANYSANEYTVSFDSDGGNEIEEVKVIFGEDYEFATPVKEGSVFLNWKNGEENVAKKGKWSIAEDVTLKADWKEGKFILFDFEGQTIGQIEILDNIEITQENVNEIVSVYEVEGYTVELKNGENVITVDEIIELTDTTTIDIIKTANEYTITFNVNGGTAIDEKKVTFDAEYSIDDATYEGYIFAGWTYEGQDFDAIGIWTIANNIELVAKWEYTITFVQDGQEDTVITLNKGEIIAEEDIPAVAEENGYNVAWDKDTAEIKALDKISTVNAVLTANEYTITFNVSGGDAIVEKKVTFDAEYSIGDATYEGYIFAGWTYEGDDFDATGTWSITKDIELVAKWKYTITFVQDEKDDFVITLNKGQKIAEGDIPELTVEAGKEKYWTIDHVKVEVADILLLNSNTTVEEFVELIQQFTITYDLGVFSGKASVSIASATQEVYEGVTDYELLEPTIDTSDVEVRDWRFVKWIESESGEEFVEGTALTKDITLVAQYEFCDDNYTDFY